MREIDAQSKEVNFHEKKNQEDCSLPDSTPGKYQ